MRKYSAYIVHLLGKKWFSNAVWLHCCVFFMNIKVGDEFLVSKETVVLRRWQSSKQKFGFIKRVDKG